MTFVQTDILIAPVMHRMGRRWGVSRLIVAMPSQSRGLLYGQPGCSSTVSVAEGMKEPC